MSLGNLMRSFTSKIFHGIPAVANAFAGTVYTTAIKLNLWQKARFIYHKAVGATGTATITLEAASDNAGTGATAIPFKYILNSNTAASDAFGVMTQATTAGFTTTAGSNQIYVIEVDARDMPAGLNFLRLKSVEVVASPVLGGVLVDVYEPRFAHSPDQMPACS